ncbi:MAG TPA: TonB-dependent receptor, partial [Cytophagales bacterium]|nr:TonB-dependent receptor [Cytophagales bacterium]
MQQTKYLAVALCLLWVGISNLSAQTIQVLNAADGAPISEVFIYNSSASESVLTNKQGTASLSVFEEEEAIYLQHPSFQTFATSKKQLREMDFRIFLQEKVVQMDEVLVSGNKWEQDRREVPNQIMRISAKEITLGNPQTSADLLAQTGEVFVQKSQLGGGSPMIRGFSANSVLIVVDGIRMNNPIYRSGNLQNILNIDANFLESAEVVLGPGSVIYGSDALGGVMDFHTANPEYSDSTTWRTGVLTRFSSANQELTASAQLAISTQRVSWILGGSYSDFNDLRTGLNGLGDPDRFGERNWYVQRVNGIDSIFQNPNGAVQVFSGFRTYSGFSKTKIRLADGLELRGVSMYNTTSDVPRYDRLIERRNGTPRNAEWYYGPQTWWFNALTLYHYRPTPLYDEMKVALGYQDYQESRNDRRFESTTLRSRTEDVDVFSFNADFDKILSETHQLFYGAEMTTNTIGSSGTVTDIDTGETDSTSTRYPDGGSTYSTLAAYLSHKWHPWETGTLTTGIRYSYVDLLARFSGQFFDFPWDSIPLSTGALNGSIGLAQRVGASWQVNALLSTGFRAPNIDDIGKVFDSEPGNVVVPNPGLRPEYVYNAELGLRYTAAEKVDLQLTGFYAWYIDAMVRREFTLDGRDSLIYDGTLSQVEAIVNAAQARIFGLSATATVRMGKHLSAKGTFTWTDGYDLDGRVPLRHTPPAFGQLSA